MHDGSRYNFYYNSYGIIFSIEHHAPDGHERRRTTYELATSATDCPRVSAQREWAENWNGDVNGLYAAGEEATATFGTSGGANWMLLPNQVTYKEFYGTGWQAGLVTQTEVWSAGLKKKWTTTAWTQDYTGASYPLNPRVTETNVYDELNNRRRTTIYYGQYEQYSLPYLVRDYAANGTTEIRHTYTDYNLGQAYLDRRIIGLVSAVHVSDTAQWLTKITYGYDDPSKLEAVPATATRHDQSFNTSFLTRGNVTSVSRWDVTDINNPAKALTTNISYNVAGSAIRNTDPSNHQQTVAYNDSFSDGQNRNTFAYPTTTTDADGFSSYVQYNFDFGAVTRTQGPPPAGQSQGAIKTMTYDAAGRIQWLHNVNNSAWKYFAYADRGDVVMSQETINEAPPSYWSITVVDGANRVRLVGGDHPGSIGGYGGAFTIYDEMGRVWQHSNPAETNAYWSPTGDDAGWFWTHQTYDWQGRPLVTTNPDGTTKEASYGGCGCAGGEVVTLKDEGTLIGGTVKKRQQKLYSDVLGRTVKTEVLNWDGVSIYSTTVQSYNALDQMTSVKRYQGDLNNAFQETVNTYDGYGRLSTTKTPLQMRPTTYVYNSDDTVWKVITPREATGASPEDVTQTLSYNNRHLPRRIEYNVPANISNPAAANYVAPTATVEFDYDGAGNRLWMTDGLGRVDYGYDVLSRLVSEARTFNDPANLAINGVTKTLTYGYNLANQVSHMIDPAGVRIDYSYYQTGRLNGVSGSEVLYGGIANYLSGVQYRAWGATKGWSYGNTRTLSVQYNSRLQLTRYEVPGVTGSEYEYATPQGGVIDNDGRVKFIRDITQPNSKFDRAYKYDHSGRLSDALTGPAARGQADTNNRPFKLTYNYDQWDNLTSRTGKYWSQNSPFSASINPTTNRNQNWTYDANGFVRIQSGVHNTYDAAGQIVKNIDTQPRGEFENGLTLDLGYDGDGQHIKHVENSSNQYFLRSSAMGGKIISDLGQSGQFLRGYVYAGNVLIAKQETGVVQWFHDNPVTGNENRTSASGGFAWPRTELDPLGIETGTFDWYLFGERPQSDSSITSTRYSDFLRQDLGCTLDFVATDCELVSRLMSAGALDFLYTFPDSRPLRPGDHPRTVQGSERFEIRPIGLGLYRTVGPVTVLDNEGERLDWRETIVAIPQNSAGQRCDERLRGIFGGPGTVFATDRDPSTLADPAHRDRNRLLSPGESPVNGHAHIYASATGAGVSGGNLFTPSSFTREERAPYTAHQDTIPELQNYHRFTYLPGALRRFGYSGGLVISFIHSGPTNSAGRPFAASASDRPGSVLVGTIGNFGGVDVGGSDPGYVHSHIRFYSADRRGRRGAPIDPRRVFCRDLGF